MSKILILTNSLLGLVCFRKELMIKLVSMEAEVFVAAPYSEEVSELAELGVRYCECKFDGASKNPINDLKLFFKYFSLIKRIKPDCVINYTVKPCIYGGMVCSILKIPYIESVTGLSPALVSSKKLIRNITIWLCRIGYKKAKCVFFQNDMNYNFFRENRINFKRYKITSGSGVNLINHPFEDYPPDGKIKILYAGRITRIKGIEELCRAINLFIENYGQGRAEFVFIGSKAEKIEIFDELLNSNKIVWHGLVKDVHKYMKECHALIMPSYAEGMSNVMLEAEACGRPVIASDIPGCKEIFDEGYSGFLFDPHDCKSIYDSICRFVDTPYSLKENMGKAARNKVEKDFDRKKVVDEYIKEIFD